MAGLSQSLSNGGRSPLNVNLTRDEEAGASVVPPSSSFLATAATRMRFLSRSVSYDSPFFRPDASSDAMHAREARRLVRRDSPFHQSSGKIYMRRGVHWASFLGLARKDWYHIVITFKLRWLLFFILLFFTTIVVFYSFLYMLADGLLNSDGSRCGVGRVGHTPSFYNAFFFSLETFTTIGYSVPFDAIVCCIVRESTLVLHVILSPPSAGSMTYYLNHIHTDV